MEVLNTILNNIPGSTVMKKYPASGQKEVYLIKNEKGDLIILKIIKEMNERVQREIDIVNKNNIIGVPKIISFQSIQHDGQEYHYLLEEYIDGDSLKNIIQKRALSLSEALSMIEYLLKATVELEELSIVHRDIKPDNIMIDNDGNYHLIDFGIARNLNLTSLTLTQAVVGPHTPGYGAPELFQYNKPKIDSKADLFSIGVVAYEVIFGRHPFVTGQEIDFGEIWYKTLTVTPKDYLIEGDIDGQLMGFIQTLMQKQPSKRPPSAKKALEWFGAVVQTLSFKR